jgi:acyl-[acyl-carrier-protein]-phospholipid O-acyltransferase/long-chain-fatty-acid--[acyl-carrier-protein] ligase
LKSAQIEKLIHHEFVRIAKKFGKKIAVIDRTTDQRVTYSRGLLVSLLFSETFKKYDDEYVGVMLPNTAGAFLTIIGLLMARKVPVLINYSTGAETNCKYAQDLCGFKTIITSKGLLEKINCPALPGMLMIEDMPQQFKKIQKLRALAYSKLPVRLLLNSFKKTDRDDTSTILFTSGSENNPKAVQLSHRNILANVVDIREAFNITHEAVFLSILPLFHVFGLTTCFWTPILTGCSTATYANPLEFKTIPKIIKEEKVTLIAGTPSFFAGYLRESEIGDFQSVEIMVAGADKTPDWLRKAYKDKHNIALYEGYGTTETSPVISANTPNANRPGSIGKPVTGAQVKITDLETNATLPPGKEGKILVKGDLVMKGYFDDFEATSMRIRDGWYDTGDMGVIDEEGYIWHRGRLKRFVKIGGEMVSMVKVETEITKLLSDDIECCVIEIPDPRKGARLAVVTTTEIEKNKIMKQLKDTLPQIAIPKIYMTLPELPKMGSGKIDFRSVTKTVRKNLIQQTVQKN